MPDPTETAARLAEARQAHAAAVQHRRECAETAGRAADHHRLAAQQRQQMLDRAGAGEPVTTADLARAGSSVAEAQDAADLAASIARAAANKLHLAEIDLLHAQAADHHARADAARQAAIEAAAGADLALDNARELLALYQSRLETLRALDREAIEFAETMTAAACSNPVLGARHASLHPRAGRVQVGRHDLCIDLTTAGYQGDRRALVSLAQHAAGLATAAPAPAPAADKAA